MEHIKMALKNYVHSANFFFVNNLKDFFDRDVDTFLDGHYDQFLQILKLSRDEYYQKHGKNFKTFMKLKTHYKTIIDFIKKKIRCGTKRTAII